MDFIIVQVWIHDFGCFVILDGGVLLWHHRNFGVLQVARFCAGLLALVKAQHLGNLCFEIYRVVTACGCITFPYVTRFDVWDLHVDCLSVCTRNFVWCHDDTSYHLDHTLLYIKSLVYIIFPFMNNIHVCFALAGIYEKYILLLMSPDKVDNIYVYFAFAGIHL